jgi:transposase
VTCWRRLRDWQAFGVWEELHQRLLVRLNEVGQIGWSRAAVDSSQIRVVLGGF